MPRGPSIHRVHKVLKHLSRNDARLEGLQKRVSLASTGPGIYRWLDKDGKVLYVGKAKNLKKRLAWYVHPRPGAFVGPWRQSFLEQITDFDVTVTNSELEALILETNLIKQLKPKYNVLMKDDKNYLYVRVTVQDPFPRIEAVRKIEEDGSKYFGPTTSGDEVRRTMHLLRRLYPFRTCKMEIEVANPLPLGEAESTQTTEDAPRSIPLEVICRHKDRTTPCLDHHIEQCSAPCIGLKTPEEYYKESIEGVITFLKGDREPAKALLLERMKQAATEKKFEQAAQFRNFLQSLEEMQERQVISDTSGENADIVGIAILSGRVHVVVLQRRNGRLIGESPYELAGQAMEIGEVLEQFLPQYYDDGIDLPDTLVIPADFPGRRTMTAWLEMKKGKKVRVSVPVRGKKSHLLQLAEKNAMEKARQQEVKWESEKANTEAALEGLKSNLDLPSLPERIEGYDISHTAGTETVGSMVVMRGGKSANDHYRSFTIRTMKSGEVDDYRALKEVLKRRLRRLVDDVRMEEKKWNERGIVIGKAKKSDQKTIEEIHATNPGDIGNDAISYKDYTVARHGETIVGFGRLFTYPGRIQTIRSIWVAPEWRGDKLGQFLVRKIVRGIKKGKAYLHTKESLHDYYASVGFRPVISPPKPLQEKLEKFHAENTTAEQTLIMMYEASQNKIDPSLSSKPDLIVIDGGKGQLSAAMEVLHAFNLDIPTIGLAKREEEVFLPDRSDPVPFPKDSQSKFLLMRLRDEAHRFANRHREMQKKHKVIRSILDDVPGLGPQTKKKLLQRFGLISKIRTATDEELLTIVSQSQLLALRERLVG